MNFQAALKTTSSTFVVKPSTFESGWLSFPRMEVEGRLVVVVFILFVSSSALCLLLTASHINTDTAVTSELSVYSLRLLSCKNERNLTKKTKKQSHMRKIFRLRPSGSWRGWTQQKDNSVFISGTVQRW